MTKAEPGRRVPAVELRFNDDGSVYWCALGAGGAGCRGGMAQLCGSAGGLRSSPRVPQGPTCACTRRCWPPLAARRFPLADVRQWCSEMVAAGTWAKHNPGAPPPAAPGAADDNEEEQEVAAALQSLSASLQTSGGGAGDADRGVVDSRRQRKRGAGSAGGQPQQAPQRELQRGAPAP